MSHQSDPLKLALRPGIIIVVGLSVGLMACVLYITEVIGVELAQATRNLLAVIIGIGASTGVVMFQAYVSLKEQQARQQKLERVEQKLLEHPGKPQLTWDLARTRLENYLEFKSDAFHLRVDLSLSSGTIKRMSRY